MFKNSIALALVALTSTPLTAQPPADTAKPVISSGGFVLARSLVGSCSSSAADQLLACRMYIMGVTDSMAMHKDNGWSPPVLCNAQELQVAQLPGIYTDYMRRHPEYSEWTAASTVYNALSERFPCTKE